MNTSQRNNGFIRFVIIIIIAIIILSYLGFDIRKIMTSDMVKNNFSYVWNFIKTVWFDYLSVPFTFAWNQAIKPLVEVGWKVLLIGIDSIKKANASL